MIKTGLKFISNISNKIKCGIHQGSVFGPFLFLVYVNHLQNALNILDLKIFADNTTLFSPISISTHFIKKFSEELKKTGDYL